MTSTASTPTSRYARLAATVDAATPVERDRLMDFLRVAAMLAVAIGHWLMAVVVIADDGALEAGSLLAAAPATQWLTWVLQVVPLFVVVAGWSSARSLSRHEGSQTAWVHSRVRRLLLPTTAYVFAVAAATPVVARLTDGATSGLVGRFLGVHLWFAASICATWLITPWLHRLWTAVRQRALVGAIAGVAIVDVAVHGLGIHPVGWANFLLVYAFATLLGFAWHDGMITRRAAGWMLALGGSALGLAVASPWYPLSLVGVPGAAQSNNSPLTLPIALIAVVHVGAIVVLGPFLRRWLQRPRVWLAVVSASRVTVTVYLWHLAGTVVLVGVLRELAPNVLAVTPLSTSWWATRPLWLGGLAIAAAPLVWLAARFEAGTTPVAPPGRRRTVAATTLATWGCAQAALAGPAAPAALGATAAAAVLGRWVPRTRGR